MRALCAGGADAFAKLGGSTRKGTIYFAPNDAELWGNTVANGIQLANQMLTAFHNAPAVPTPKRLDALVRIPEATHTHLQHRNQRTDA